MQDRGPVADDILADELDFGLFPEVFDLCELFFNDIFLSRQKSYFCHLILYLNDVGIGIEIFTGDGPASLPGKNQILDLFHTKSHNLFNLFTMIWLESFGGNESGKLYYMKQPCCLLSEFLDQLHGLDVRLRILQVLQLGQKGRGLQGLDLAVAFLFCDGLNLQVRLLAVPELFVPFEDYLQFEEILKILVPQVKLNLVQEKLLLSAFDSLKPVIKVL